jgi:hypothetical protein
MMSPDLRETVERQKMRVLLQKNISELLPSYNYAGTITESRVQTQRSSGKTEDACSSQEEH